MAKSSNIESSPNLSLVRFWVNRILLAVSMAIGTIGNVDWVLATDLKKHWTWPVIGFVQDHWAFIQPIILVLSIFGFLWNEQRRMRQEFVTRPEHDTVRRTANDDSQIVLLQATVERLESSNEEMRKQNAEMNMDLAATLEETKIRLHEHIKTVEDSIPKTRILDYPPFRDYVSFNDYILDHIQGIVGNMVNPYHERLLLLENDIRELKEAAKHVKD